MTFCLAIRVQEGLVGIADTRVVTGAETITARKLELFTQGDRPFFVMTSGLRSVRDKTLTYFHEALADQPEPIDKLYKVANLLAAQIRQAAAEDREALERSGLAFNLHVLLGGELAGDPTHQLLLMYPQANWVEVGPGTPYSIIGTSGYGKPVLDRTLKYEDSLRHALKVGMLAFDSTRISAADVDPPVDVALYRRDTHRIIEHRFEPDELAEMSSWWQERMRESVRQLPAQMLDRVVSKLPHAEALIATGEQD